MATGVSVKLPLRVTKEDGPYGLNKDLISTVKQNFKDLVLTAPGERMMDTEFGVGVYALLFENYTSEAKEKTRARIVEQAKYYMPFVQIRSINFDDSEIDSNKIYIGINYFISALNYEDILQINLNGESF